MHNVFSKFRAKLVDMADEYPSIINNGYRHIEKVIELSRFFNLEPSNAIIDIGGADGVIATKLAIAFPNATVYTYEPIVETYQILKNNVAFYSNIISVNKGLGVTSGEFVINMANRITSSSLLQIEERITDNYFAENLKKQNEVKVIISLLDEELPQDIFINIIKIDVQGYELEVLKGSVNTLKRTSIIVLEMQNHELYVNAPKYYVLDEFLRQNGFCLYDIVPSIRRSKKLYEWDSIYVHQNIAMKYSV